MQAWTDETTHTLKEMHPVDKRVMDVLVLVLLCFTFPPVLVLARGVICDFSGPLGGTIATFGELGAAFLRDSFRGIDLSFTEDRSDEVFCSVAGFAAAPWFFNAEFNA